MPHPCWSWPFTPVALDETNPRSALETSPKYSESVPFSADVLRIDPQQEADKIVAFLREQVGVHLGRKGVVLGISGGIESSVCAALAVRAFGNKRVLGLLMPELDTAPENEQLTRNLTAQLGIAAPLEDISPILSAAGCYLRRDQAIRAVLPEFGTGYRLKLSSAKWLSRENTRRVEFLVEKPDGSTIPLQLTQGGYEALVAALHFKQRTRRMIEYFYADQLHYAVIGTSNLLQYDQGDFVKNGDGAADVKPIAHLYKTQVDQLAEFLDIPESIRTRPRVGRTLTFQFQGQEDTLFVSECDLDLCLYAMDHGIPTSDLAAVLGVTPDRAGILCQDIATRRTQAAYLHAGPMLMSRS